MSDTGHAGLSAKQEKALLALLSGMSPAEVADNAGCSPRTLRRWQNADAWKATLGDTRRQAFTQAVTQLQASASDAVTGLLRVIRDRDAPPGAVVSACRAVLELGLKGSEQLDVLERLDALEARLDINNGGWK